jgi:hypothetical protein
MHRTLFTPSMVETFRTCKKAYEAGYTRFNTGGSSQSLTGACKRFVLRALSEINRGKLSTVHQVQKYMGQEWPLDKVGDGSSQKEFATHAFLFALKSLSRYVAKPYRPSGSEVAAVALKVRVRVAHVRVYLEDTIDLVLWYPQERRLELVNYQMQPLKPADPAWPNSSTLIKTYLAERLKIRWPFEKLTITSYRAGTQDYSLSSLSLDDAIYRVHWEEMLKTLEEMKQPPSPNTQCSLAPQSLCRLCATMKCSGVSESTFSTYPPAALSA